MNKSINNKTHEPQANAILYLPMYEDRVCIASYTGEVLEQL